MKRIWTAFALGALCAGSARAGTETVAPEMPKAPPALVASAPAELTRQEKVFASAVQDVSPKAFEKLDAKVENWRVALKRWSENWIDPKNELPADRLDAFEDAYARAVFGADDKDYIKTRDAMMAGDAAGKAKFVAAFREGVKEEMAAYHAASVKKQLYKPGEPSPLRKALNTATGKTAATPVTGKPQPPPVPAVPPVAGLPDALTDYEKQVIAAINQAHPQDVAQQLKTVAANAGPVQGAALWRNWLEGWFKKYLEIASGPELDAFEESYIHARLGPANGGKYAALKAAALAGDAAKKSGFVNGWRDAVVFEIQAWRSVTIGQKKTFRPPSPWRLENMLAEKDPLRAALEQGFPKSADETKFTEAVIVDFLLRGTEESKQRERALILKAMQEKKPFPPEIKAKYAALAAKAARAELLGAEDKVPGLSDYLTANGIAKGELLDYYCPIRPERPNGASSEQEREKARVQAENAPQAGAVDQTPTPEAVKEAGAGTFDGQRSDPFAQMCNDRAQERIRNAPSDLNRMGPSMRADVPLPSRPTQRIGEKPKGEKDPPPADPNANRDWINGAKFGIVALVAASILLGPVGGILIGVAAFGAGWWMSKEINK